MSGPLFYWTNPWKKHLLFHLRQNKNTTKAESVIYLSPQLWKKASAPLHYHEHENMYHKVQYINPIKEVPSDFKKANIMKRRYSRILSIIAMILMVIFLTTACTKQEAPVVQETAPEQAPVVETVVEKPAEPEGPKPALRGRPTKPEAPKLPFEITEDMDFFEDGYEIVTVAALADGDTTTFNLKSGTKTTRYLAIDTPETSNGVDPWGPAAKRYVNDLLTNAKQIVLEKEPALTGAPGEDNGTLDKYGRLLAHVWVDGELVQYKVVEQQLAKVAYLYYDYKYNDVLLKLEAYQMFADPKRVNNSLEKDPEYDYSDRLYDVEIADLGKGWNGKRVRVRGIVNGNLDKNGYIQTPDGESAIYVYTNHNRFKAIQEGNEIEFIGRYSIYNGLPEIGSPEVAPTIISTGNDIVMWEGTTEFVDDERNISKLVYIPNLTVDSIRGGNVMMHDELGSIKVYVDKYLDFQAADVFEVGKTYNLTGNVSVFNDEMQLKVRNVDDIEEVK